MHVPRRVGRLRIACAREERPEPDGKGSYDDLIALFKEFQAWKASGAPGVTTDYSPAAIEKRKAQLAAFQARVADMGVARWQKAQKVDYVVVRAELDKEQFIQQVTRPWARDPVFYVAELQEVPFADVPASGENLQTLQKQLRAIPGYLAQARSNLTEAAADYADLAISLLERSDGVEAGYPARPVPPPGVIGWYDDMLARAEKQRALKPDIEKARKAIVEFQSWLKANRPQMTARAGVGKEREGAHRAEAAAPAAGRRGFAAQLVALHPHRQVGFDVLDRVVARVGVERVDGIEAVGTVAPAIASLEDLHMHPLLAGG